MFHKALAAKYPESFDASVPEDLVYSGKYALTDVEPETGMTVGKLVLSPTRTYAPVVKKLLDTMDRRAIHGQGLTTVRSSFSGLFTRRSSRPVSSFGGV